MDDQLVTHALSLVLDDIRVCKWVTAEVDRRLGRKGPQDLEFWRTYTTVTNDLIDAVRAKNDAG
ncbi:hypothetical protein [Bradyrhizobium sp. CCBAU 25338]|uniref:hypothetical protein n=1 Tax=Bradyrhizobium sp. CCBAU 25338 TaxID=1641877 RepID=UPI0023021B9D|nr:hypothetical protein [Bradyrhizobium sp. CCBAU 25338]MDA9529793.1 hypothetical protein [Bradyrhizobium sp. CCBAU 25338]